MRGHDVRPEQGRQRRRQGCRGTRYIIKEPSACGRILKQALATSGAVAVQGVVDPLVPPLPAKATCEQAKQLTEAWARGAPNRGKIAWTVFAEKVREMIE